MIEAGQPVPVHPDRPNRFNPIHEDDIIRMLPAAARDRRRPGDDRELGRERAGRPRGVVRRSSASSSGSDVAFVETEQTIGSVIDRHHEDARAASGDHQVDWRDGMRRMVEAQHRML